MNARPVSLFIVFLFFFFQGLSQAKVGGGISTPLQSKTLQKADKQFFIENKGQWPFEVLYLTQSPGLNTWITRKGMWFEYYKIEEIEPLGSKSNEKFSRLEKFETVETRRSGHRVGYTLVGNNQNVQTEPNGKQECYYNYLLGNDPSKHASYVGLYKEVKVNEVYKGIGMRYYFEKGNLRYDFIVEPGADPNQIQFRFEGSEKSYLNANGELVFTTSFGEVKNADLFCYQLLNNGTSLKSVTAKFDRRQENWVINLGDYDNEQTLIIDPLIYSTYMGGNSIDEGRSIVLDTFKNAYITGTTHSPNYDVTAGAFQTLFAGNSDVFVSKLNANGSALIYSTYIGGGGTDYGSDIAIDLSGEVYITGSTRSLNYPITAGAFQSINAGNADIFVTKLSSTGSSLIYSTFLGGASTDAGQEIVLDTLGNAYVTGYAGSLDFDITPGAFQINNSGSGDAFVTKLNSMGTGLIYSTFIGGTNNEWANSIDIDVAGNIYITGETESTNYPTTIGAFQTSLGGFADVFVTKLNPTGTTVIYSTFIGGLNSDYGYGIVVDSVGSAFVSGRTFSSDFDVTVGAYQTVLLGGGDAFVIKLNATGTTLLYSTYVGGSLYEDTSYDIEIDSFGNAIITGETASADYYVTPGAFQISNGGGYDGFVSKLNASGTAMIYSTFIGGLSSDVCFSATLDNSNYLYVTGWTHASNFPIIAGAFQSFYSGNVDVFISKVELIPCLIVTLPISNSPLCEGQTLNLTVTPTAGATYNWSGPNGFTSVLQNPNIANVSMAANGVYTITVTSANGCTNSDTVNVLINPLPSVVANNDTTICEGQTLDLTVTPTAGATYNWTGPNGFTSPLQNPSIANVTLAATGVYSITIIDVNGCSNSDTTNVLINPLPTAIANNDTTLCEGQTLDLTVTPTAGATYNWSGPNGFTSPLQNPSIANVTLAATGVYTITIIDVNGCSNSDTTNVLINPLPTVIANNDTTLCEEQTLSLNVNAVGGAAYNWTGPNGFTSALQNPSIVNVTMAANGVYTIAIYDANGCSNSDTTNVLINALPTVISNNDTTLCEGQTLNLTVTPTVGAAYSWTGPNGFTSALQNPSITNVTIATNGVYTITAIDVNGCSNSDTTNVLINALPTVISNNDTTLCEGQTLSLTVNATAGATYNWTGPNGFSSAIQNPFIVNVTLAATGTYTVVVVDTNGCSKSDTTYVKVVNCTGIDDYTLGNSIFIYPNPNNGTFTLETNRPGIFELFDMAGRIIHTYEVKSSPYTITEKLSSGMYFIREKDSGASIRNRVAQKVIIE